MSIEALDACPHASVASVRHICSRALSRTVSRHNIPGGTSYEPECWVTHVAVPKLLELVVALQLVSLTQVTLLLAPQSVPVRAEPSESSLQYAPVWDRN